MNFHMSRTHAALLATLLIIIMILVPLLETTSVTHAKPMPGTSGITSLKGRMIAIAARSRAFAAMLERTGLLDRAVGSTSEQLELEPMQILHSRTVWYWRYMSQTCFVRPSSFASLKVDWANWGAPGYIGDCHFYVEYGMYYDGEIDPVSMGSKILVDTHWKKNMPSPTDPSNLKAPYYWLTPPTSYDCANGDCGPTVDPGAFAACDTVTGLYEPTTGMFTMEIGNTNPSGSVYQWQCGVWMEILTNNGLDTKVFSPKPGVSYSILPKTTPEKQLAGTQYKLTLSMKGFGLQSPVGNTWSDFDYAYWWIEAPPWDADLSSCVGMWADAAQPSWRAGRYGYPGHTLEKPLLDCRHWGGATWKHYNDAWNYYTDDNGREIHELPTTPKILFPPSSVSIDYESAGGTTVAPNWYDDTTGAGFFYDVQMNVGYVHKAASFISDGELQFSAPNNPEISGKDGRIYLDMNFYGAYPDFTLAW